MKRNNRRNEPSECSGSCSQLSTLTQDGAGPRGGITVLRSIGIAP